MKNESLILAIEEIKEDEEEYTPQQIREQDAIEDEQL